jgi:hypothetical protein
MKPVELVFKYSGLPELNNQLEALATHLTKAAKAYAPLISAHRRNAKAVDKEAEAYERLGKALAIVAMNIKNAVPNSNSSIPMIVASSMSGSSGSSSKVKAPPIYKPPKPPKPDPSFMDRFMDMLSTSRVSLNGKMMMPLVGKVAKTFGVSSFAVTAAYEAISAIRHVTNALNSFAVSLYRTGGTVGQLGNYMAIGKLLGMDYGAAADRFGTLINGGGVAAAIARRAGIDPVGNVDLGYGDTNYGEKLKKALDYILNEPNNARSRQAAHAWGMEDMSWARWLSPEHKKEVINSSYNTTPEQLQKSAEVQFQWNKALMQGEQLLMKLGEILLPLINAALTALNWVAEAISWITDPIGKSAEAARKWFGGEDAAKAQEANTKAVKDLTNAIVNQGVYGGGDRVGRAVPGAWGSVQINNAATNAGIGIGAL